MIFDYYVSPDEMMNIPDPEDVQAVNEAEYEEFKALPEKEQKRILKRAEYYKRMAERGGF